MSVTTDNRLPFDEPGPIDRVDRHDRAARERAVDPRHNVVLEASAGTGKTRVLVDRYVNLLKSGVNPSNILAITFTRKAAAEMRERIVATLRDASARGDISAARWTELRDRTGDISVSTIDAFCLSLLREFPLEADLDPGFSMADETEAPRFIDEALDRGLRICRNLAREDENVALVFAQLGERRARAGLTALVHRRMVAQRVLPQFLARTARDVTAAGVSRQAADALLGVFAAMPGGFEQFTESGPPEPAFLVLIRTLQRLRADTAPGAALDPAGVQAAFARTREHFLTRNGQPRSKLSYTRAQFTTESDWRTHRGLVVAHAGAVLEAWVRYRRDLNVLVSRGVWRMFRVAVTEYRRTLDAHAVLDFSEVLLRALALLGQMEEFAQSRFRLESRYHHVLVDEFQDTSRAQWGLVSLLIKAWGEGSGLAHTGPLSPSIFIVGDRKQSIYGFRDADLSVLRTAGRQVEGLRSGGDVKRSISRSFRAVPGLLSFVNDLCRDMDSAVARPDAFRYEEADRFPVADTSLEGGAVLGAVMAESLDQCASRTALEIAALLASGASVRDRDTGLTRAVRAGDFAILFRTRESHREFEDALERLGVPTYVYKGLGFFDADEIKDVRALLGYLADPGSNLRAASLLRSRLVGLSDEGLRRLAPHLSDALGATVTPRAAASLDAADAEAFRAGRAAVGSWLRLVDRLPPAELLDRILSESAYAIELRGPRLLQARENLKKLRALIRRLQNRGYATLERVAAHLDRVALGDEAAAALDARDAVNLMTVHAAKGLEFPIVFLVNLARGTGNRQDPIRIGIDPAGEATSVSVGDFRSDADEDDGAREREETKRLLYVAVTRARDRLYFGATLKEGRLQPGRGSLAEILPTSLLDCFGSALGEGEAMEWRPSSGSAHRFSVCGDREPPKSQERVVAPLPDSDFGPLVDAAVPRVPVSSAIFRQEDAVLRDERTEGRDSERIVGTLVHRLLARLGFGISDAALVRSTTAGLLRPEEVDEADPNRLVEQATALYEAIVRRPDVRELYDSGTVVLHEVPFTMRDEGVLVRGTIDCLVRTEKQVTVLEFKTGRPRPQHQRQVDIYGRAAHLIFPGCGVASRIVYVPKGEIA